MSQNFMTMLPKNTILGIDPGIGRMGWAIISQDKPKPLLVSYGCIETTPNSPQTDRLMVLSTQLTGVIKKYKPTIVAIEKLFFSKNVKTALSVAEARGAIILSLKILGLDILEFSPQQVKQAATGQGNADKLMVQKMIKLTFGLKQAPKSDDAADALALALCAYSRPKYLKNII